ncbi:hypothetical protein GGR09_001579 [Bartonella heixiaziensis]
MLREIKCSFVLVHHWEIRIKFIYHITEKARTFLCGLLLLVDIRFLRGCLDDISYALKQKDNICTLYVSHAIVFKQDLW